MFLAECWMECSAGMLLVVMLVVVVGTMAMVCVRGWNVMLDCSALFSWASGVLHVAMLDVWDALFLGSTSSNYGELRFWNAFSLVCS